MPGYTDPDAFQYPIKGDDVTDLDARIQELAESLQAFASGDLGLRVLHPTSVSAPDGTVNVAANGEVQLVGVSSVSVGGVFDWTKYKQVRVVLTLNAIYADRGFNLRANAAGVDEVGQVYGWTRGVIKEDGTAPNDSLNNGTAVAMSLPPGGADYSSMRAVIEMSKAVPEAAVGGSSKGSTNLNYNVRKFDVDFWFNPTVDNFDGITIYPISATQFNGNIRFFAYN